MKRVLAKRIILEDQGIQIPYTIAICPSLIVTELNKSEMAYFSEDISQQIPDDISIRKIQFRRTNVLDLITTGVCVRSYQQACRSLLKFPNQTKGRIAGKPYA